ncbi:hypothetical protein BU25DRAFT_480051 [Macroventuria anomochaeta]|uniref:Uncharacterized protein n=1 Tax=Macroventuria anomochaeta TaxID=301207 RepID=A0ACB6RP73_9PLEO|nr:uncharacterized protein BU25DRAFT_480051 [Macroventuria anomochaeta]KAF2622928.1 hypothetical protein BU25DRAFT_480051 [Macroventuria anomochaeta]
MSHVAAAVGDHHLSEGLPVILSRQAFTSDRNSHLMLIDFERAFIFLSTASLPRLLSSPTLANMDSLDSPFTIELNGSPIANIGSNAGDKTQARTGPDAAVFILKDGRLQYGDWVLGRSKTENRSMLPKEVYWFKSGTDDDKKAKPVAAHQDGDSIQLKFGGSSLMLEDDKIFTDLLGDDRTEVVVKLQS